MKQIIQNLKSGETILDDVPAPIVKRSHVLIQTTCSLVSLGTEKMLVEFGQAGLISKARQQPEKVKQVIDKIKTDGLLPTLSAVQNKLDQPIPLGYCNVGIVKEIGADVSEFKIGDRVVSNGSHAEYVCIPKNLVATIPESVADSDASFTVVSAIGLQGIRLANPTMGETVVVIGLGLIGLLTAQMLQASGCKVMGFDFDTSKIELAKLYGIDAHNSGTGIDPVKVVLQHTHDIGCDAVIITASTPSNEVIHQAAEMSRKRGRIILVGVIGLQLNRADFYQKELSFQVSCSYGAGRYDDNYEAKGQDYPIAYVRWTEKRNFETVLQLMQSHKLQVGDLITKRVSLDNVVDIYTQISEHKNQIGILIEYPFKNISDSATHIVQISKNDNSTSKTTHPSKGNLSIIGAGNFTQAMILPCLKKAGANMVSIVSSKGVSGNHAARKFGISKSSTSFDDVLADSACDTVIISTPHNTHASMVCQSLNAGKNVFVEKPLAINREQLADVYNTYQKHSELQLVVGFNRRYSPLVQKIKQLLPSTSEPLNMSFVANAGFIPKNHWTQDAAIGGGRIIGESCHYIDLLSYICGSPILAVCSNALGTSPDTNSDNLTIQLKFANGSNGTVHYFANGNKGYSKERLEVYGSGKVLILDNFKSLHGFGFKNFKSQKLWSQDKGHQNQFATLLQSIQSGQPMVSFESIYNSSLASIAAIESVEQGGWVKI